MSRVPINVLACVCLLLLPGLLPSQEEDLHTQLMRATLKIGHPKSTATGFVLRRPAPADEKKSQFILVTAAHVLELTTGDEATLYYRKKESEGVYKKEPVKLIIRADGKPLWTKHPTEDVAVMVVTPPKDADLPEVSVDLLATDETLKKYKVHPGDAVYCLGYPHREESNEMGFSILRSGSLASYPLTPTKLTKSFLLSMNSFEGDSGGPTYLADTNRVVTGMDKREDVRLILGLVSAQRFLDEEMKMAYGTTKLRHRLGLAYIVHASFIRETIGRLP